MTTLKEQLIEIGTGMDGQKQRVYIVKPGKTFRGTLADVLALAPAVGFDMGSRVLCVSVGKDPQGREEFQVTVNAGGRS